MAINKQEFRDFLRATLDDARLSRKERRELRYWLREHRPDERELALLRKQIFDVAHELSGKLDAGDLLRWVEESVQALQAPFDQDAQSKVREAHFSPGLEVQGRIRALLQDLRKSADICVFTITDDDLTSEIIKAHERGVAVRVISDNDKCNDRGSDIDRLAQAGVPVAMDRSDAHMHHKFALFDERLLLTGSYNWTRSAFQRNQENVLVTSDPNLLTPYSDMFELLWDRWGNDNR